ncbi:PadR family transcriptional regulator [Flammeovirgaceae bacterium SG7u.111]|nr:PadR family transcriptional regulator [Flammeovirgaceae bacterium SG7u.132]WPO33205.1 PadR family transcriptional regulator [Flammeovirgaceae bacterium SG7u.111]
MKRLYLGEFEELVMLAVAILQGEAYGIAVMDEIKEQSGRNSTISTVHETLIRLEKKGFLTSYTGGATKVRGGRKKRYFELTAYGKKAINETRELRNNMWQQVPQIIWEGGNI